MDGDRIPRTRGPLSALLAERGLTLRRRDGQNFLVEPGAAEAIVRSAGVTREDHVVEVGPGAGALTQPLLAVAGHVTVVELDRGLASLLTDRLGGDPRLTIVHGDALDGADPAPGEDSGPFLHPAIEAALRSPAPGCARTRIVANLPYSVGTEIVIRLLRSDAPPASAVLMLQEEVVERLTAKPGTDAYGPLAVLATLAAEVTPLRRVPPSAFLPPPDVESLVFALRPRTAANGGLPPADVRAVSELARKGFAQRRKTLQNNLRGTATPEEIRAAGLDPAARAETVPAAGFLALRRVLAARGAGGT